MSAASIRDTAKATAISGLILIPWVSSSKKRSSPALAAGIGELLSRRFSLRLNVCPPSGSCVLVMLDLINVASSNPEAKESGFGTHG